jgi:hypothetical protein
MSSPFAGFENAVLMFETATGAYTTDNVTGNRKLTRTSLEVIAILTEKRPPKQARSPGVDQQAIYLEGYAVRVGGNVETTQLPASVQANTWATCTWAGITGKFYLILTGRSPYGVESVAGDKIRGWFQAHS